MMKYQRGDIETILVIAVAISVLAALILAGFYDARHEAALREAFVSFCAADTAKADPGISQNEALARCEVEYEMEKERRPKDAMIVWMVNP